MEGLGIRTEGAEEQPVGKHLERAVIRILNGLAMSDETRIRGEEVAEGDAGLEVRVLYNLLMVVPHEPIADAIAVGNQHQHNQAGPDQCSAKARVDPGSRGCSLANARVTCAAVLW